MAAGRSPLRDGRVRPVEATPASVPRPRETPDEAPDVAHPHLPSPPGAHPDAVDRGHAGPGVAPPVPEASW